MTTNSTIFTRTVGQLVAERPERGRVFEQLGIDYCCGGRKLLQEACAQKGLDVEAVRSELEASDAGPSTIAGPDWNNAPLASLADNIESTHHEFMRSELARTSALVKKVASAHGDRHPELRKLESVFEAFAQELQSHMLKEETVLFPWIRDLEAMRIARPSSSNGINVPISRMMHEHDGAGSSLQSMRELTNGFTPPIDACGTYRVMLSALKDIENDMHTHVHKENNILFPKSLALESKQT